VSGRARNTVKRVLRLEGEAYEYWRVRQPMPKLGPFLVTLDGWLGAEEKLPARERRTAQRLTTYALFAGLLSNRPWRLRFFQPNGPVSGVHSSHWSMLDSR